MEYVNNFSKCKKNLQLFFLTIVQINVCMCLTFFLGETLNLPSQSLTLCSQRHTEHRIAVVMIVLVPKVHPINSMLSIAQKGTKLTYKMDK